MHFENYYADLISWFFILVFVFLKPLSTHIFFIDWEGNIPPHNTSSHEGVDVVGVGGVPVLELFRREHLHHIILHCVVVVAVTVSVDEIFEGSLHTPKMLCGDVCICLDAQLSGYIKNTLSLKKLEESALHNNISLHGSNHIMLLFLVYIYLNWSEFKLMVPASSHNTSIPHLTIDR